VAEETTPTITTPSTAVRVPANGVGEAEKLVPSFRLEQESERAREAEATRDSALQQLNGMKEEYEKLKAAYDRGRTNYSADMHLLERGFKHESVRRFFRKEYRESVAELPADKRPDFGSWLDANQEDPLYRVHFESLNQGTPKPENQADAPMATEFAAPAAEDNLISALRAVLNGNPDSGTSQPADNRQQEWTAEAIRKVRAKNGGTLGDAKDQILAQWRAKKIIK